MQLIEPSNYDQSCKVDSDCVNVSKGDACLPCIVSCPSGGAINRGDLPKYQSDISKTVGYNELTGVVCHCPAIEIPCCRAGTCHADLECSGVAIGGRGDGAAVDAQE
jgi:hypothetical protein